MPRDRTRTVERMVGERLRRLRTARGLSQAALGEALDVSYQQVHKYETGENRIGPSRMLAIARVLEVPVGYFLEGLEADDAADPPEPPDLSARVLAAAHRLYGIRNRKIRDSLLTLIWTLGADGAEDTDRNGAGTGR